MTIHKINLADLQRAAAAIVEELPPFENIDRMALEIFSWIETTASNVPPILRENEDDSPLTLISPSSMLDETVALSATSVPTDTVSVAAAQSAKAPPPPSLFPLPSTTAQSTEDPSFISPFLLPAESPLPTSNAQQSASRSAATIKALPLKRLP